MAEIVNIVMKLRYNTGSRNERKTGKQIIKFGGKSKDAVSLRSILFRYSILHPFKYRKIKRQSRQIIKENDQLLEMLGSDYDDNNKPYWENTES